MAPSTAGTKSSSRPNPAGAGLAAASALLGFAGFALFAIPGLLVALLISAAAGAFLFARRGSAPPAASLLVTAGLWGDEAGAKPPVPIPEAIPEDRIDPVTGLANENGLRAWFQDRIPRLIEDRKGIVVLSAALEGLETIVQTRGQAIANKVLVEVARRISVYAGADGLAARTGGGEFASEVSVVSERWYETATDNAAKLAEMLQRPVELPEGVIWIGGSVGAAAGPAGESTGVLDRARAALAKAKGLGRGHYVVDRP